MVNAHPKFRVTAAKQRAHRIKEKQTGRVEVCGVRFAARGQLCIVGIVWALESTIASNLRPAIS